MQLIYHEPYRPTKSNFSASVWPPRNQCTGACRCVYTCTVVHVTAEARPEWWPSDTYVGHDPKPDCINDSDIWYGGGGGGDGSKY